MAVQFPKVKGIPSCINLSTYVQGMSDYEILCQVVQVVNKLSELASLSVITYADPIDWNITTQYSQNTVVVDPTNGTAYLSTQPVPSGVQISNSEYWTPIFTLENFTTFLKTAITTEPQQENGQAATNTIPAGKVFFVGDKLCYNQNEIPESSLVIIGSNCVELSLMDIINYALQQINDLSKQIEDLTKQVAENRILNVDSFGAVGDGVTDDTEAFNAMFSKQGIYTATPGKTYKIDGVVNCNYYAVFYLCGATLYLTQRPIQSDNAYALNFKAGAEISGGSIVSDTADWWDSDVSIMQGVACVNITGRAYVHDMQFSNIWGYAVRALSSAQVHVSNCDFYNVGGHYKENNQYDMFGDCVYCGDPGSNTSQQVVVESCRMVGKTNGTTLSRCGVTLEYGNTCTRNLTVISCHITNFDRALHVENTAQARVSFKDCYISANVYAFQYGGTDQRYMVSFENCEIYTTGNDYGGTRGARGWNYMSFKNCYIKYAGAMIFSLNGAQFSLLEMSNCYINSVLRGTATVSPMIEAGNSLRAVVQNCFYEASTAELGAIWPSDTKVMLIGGIFAAGAQGWTGNTNNTYAFSCEVTGLTGVKATNFTG